MWKAVGGLAMSGAGDFLTGERAFFQTDFGIAVRGCAILCDKMRSGNPDNSVSRTQFQYHFWFNLKPDAAEA
jgi:hypothetical protein